MRILIADDELAVAKALKVILERSRYAVDVVDNGTDALAYALTSHYNLIILDIMMPEMDGIEVLKYIRKKGIETPILLFTAKSDIDDRVFGLEAGADDYLPKPFATSEFVARVNALMRRSNFYMPKIITISNTSLDCNSYELFTQKERLKLSNKEFQLLELFMRNPRNIFSTNQLMEQIWGLDSESDIGVVWTYIAFLRKKLTLLTSNIEIKTIRGAGYVLEVLSCSKS